MIHLSGNESEGTRIRALSPLRRFGQVLSRSPHCLVSRVKCFRNDPYKAVERISTRPIVLSMSMDHTFDVECV